MRITASTYDLTEFQRDCLYVIAGLDERKGLAVKAALDEYYASETNHDRLYPQPRQPRRERTRGEGFDRRSDELESRRSWEDQHVEL